MTTVIVPQVVGLSVKRAVVELEAASVWVCTPLKPPTADGSAVVVSQARAAGSKPAEGSDVTLATS